MSYSKTKLVVAALDFGTTYSGYAYSFQTDYELNLLKIYANSSWLTGGGSLATLKAPTVVLFDKEKTFKSFGFQAEEEYAQLAETDDHIGLRYFKRFKMNLLKEKKLRRNMLIKDDQDNKMEAIEVFAAAIKFLKNHLMEQLIKTITKIRENDVHYVLTVPAIWNDGAKQFMKEAAQEAGIPEDQLSLALEPEAAAIYCKECAIFKSQEENRPAELQTFAKGAQFMAIDLGGGTVDITVHKVMQDGTLHELCPASGGPWGGIQVDSAFKEFLKIIVSQDVLNDFATDAKLDELQLFRDFELKKRTIKPECASSNILLRIPMTLVESFKRVRHTNFDENLKQLPFATDVVQKRDKLLIKQHIFLNMFNECKQELVKHLQNIFRQPELRGVNTILMVGGFSESGIMTSEVKRQFPYKTVIVPPEAGLAVLKGAVIYGHNPNAISSRKMSHTYGISVAVPYDDKIHPRSKRVIYGGIEKCEDVYHSFIRAGTTVVPGKTSAEHTFNASRNAIFGSSIEIYKTQKEEPQFITDKGCHKVGEIQMELKRSATVSVKMCFGNTELMVEATEHGTNNKIQTKFNFLN